MLNFGIELEVLVKYEDIDNFLKVIDNHAKELLIRNKDFLGNNHYLFTDGSVEPPHNSFDFGYELKTKKLEFNISNFNKFSKFFEELSKVAYSNDTCGIHVHCSRKYFSLKKHFALLYAYIKNRYYKNFLEIENCQMSNSTYASLSRSKNYYYNRINRAIKNNKKIYIDVSDFERKVDLYKVHIDYNTIEFRGLRKHFTECSNTGILNAIEEYLKIMEVLEYDKKIVKVFTFE